MEKIVKVMLSEPLHTLAGDDIQELTLDFGKIKARDMASINRIESRLKGASDTLSVASMSKASSTEWRIAFSWVAACRGTKGICYDDIDALCIADTLELSNVCIPFVVVT